MFRRNFIPVVLCTLLALTFASVSAPAQEPSANEILTRVAATYASCRSYYDEGSIKSGSKALGNGIFRTTFVRPNHLAFELWSSREDKERHRGWVVWKSGEQVTSWLPWNIGSGLGPRREPPVDMALERLAYPSAGSSLIISPLLFPDWFRTSDLLASISDVRLAGSEKIDGRETFRLEGMLWRRQPIKLWIDKTQHVIVKISRRVLLGDSEVETTVLLKPKLNTDIPPQLLQPKIPDWRADLAPFLSARSSPSSHSNMPILAPAGRNFGSSLGLSPNERTRRSAKRAADEDDVVRVDTDLVVAAVLVLDAEGKIVSGLGKDDFVVKEDDGLQEVASVSLGDSQDTPRSIVLVIDYSRSQLPYIKTSIDAAQTLVDKLNPKDRMAVVTDDVNLLVDFTSDKDLLKTRLESLKQSALSGTAGASNQYDALLAAMTELFSVEDARPIIIFQTDGDQLEALKGGSPQPYNVFSLPRKFGLEDISTATERSRVAVYSVISGVRFFGVPETELLKRAEADLLNRENATQLRGLNNSSAPVEPRKFSNDDLQKQANIWLRRHTALAAVAKFTGAWTEFLEEPSQADEIYNRILTDIDRRYVLGYYPTNRARDGKRRKVQIEIRNHPEYIVWGQKTYFAREEQ